MLTFKRTGTFYITGQITVYQDNVNLSDLTGWTGQSELRTGTGDLVANLNFTWLDAAQRTFKLEVLDPSAWPLGIHNFDILLTAPDAFVVPTHTGQIRVEGGVTGA